MCICSCWSRDHTLRITLLENFEVAPNPLEGGSEIQGGQLSYPEARLTLLLFFLFLGFAALAAGKSPSVAPELGDVCLIYGTWRTLRG